VLRVNLKWPPSIIILRGIDFHFYSPLFPVAGFHGRQKTMLPSGIPMSQNNHLPALHSS